MSGGFGYFIVLETVIFLQFSLIMWPPVLDFSKDDCRRLLRRMELEAYSSIVSVFRAQGYLSTEKKRVMQELQSMLRYSLFNDACFTLC